MSERIEATEALLATIQAGRARVTALSHRALPFDASLRVALAGVGASARVAALESAVERDSLAAQPEPVEEPGPVPSLDDPALDDAEAVTGEVAVVPAQPEFEADVETIIGDAADDTWSDAAQVDADAEPETGALEPAAVLPDDPTLAAADEPLVDADEEATWAGDAPDLSAETADLPAEAPLAAEEALPADDADVVVQAEPGVTLPEEEPTRATSRDAVLAAAALASAGVAAVTLSADADAAAADDGLDGATEATTRRGLDEAPITLDELIRDDLPAAVADPSAVDAEPTIDAAPAVEDSPPAPVPVPVPEPDDELESTTIADMPPELRAAIAATPAAIAVDDTVEETDDDISDTGDDLATTVSETPPEVRAAIQRSPREDDEPPVYRLGQPRAVGVNVGGTPAAPVGGPQIRLGAPRAQSPRVQSPRVQTIPTADAGRGSDSAWSEGDTSNLEVIENRGDIARPEPAGAAAIQILGVGKARTITPTLELGSAEDDSLSNDVPDPGGVGAGAGGFSVGFVEPDEDPSSAIPELTAGDDDDAPAAKAVLTPDGMVASKHARVAEASEYDQDVRSFVDAARDAESNGDLRGAVTAWGDVLDLRPSDVDAHLGRGRALVELMDYAAAMSDFQRAEDLAPESASPIYEMGNLFFSRMEYSKAIPYFDHAIDMDPGHAMSWCRRGISHHHRKNHTQAVADLQKASTLDPDIPGLRSYVQMAIKAMQRRRR